jgi:hypothetical protein
METNGGKIHEAIAAIMEEVGGVAKSRTNPQQGYKYRGIADVTLACQPIMAKHKVHLSPHAILNEVADYMDTKSGGKMLHVRQTIEYRFYHADGSFVPCVVTGEAMDSGDKTSNKVMSAALKYALTQTFCIPETDPDVDTEAQSPEAKPPAAKPQAEQPKAPATQPARKPSVSNPEDPITQPQQKAIHALLTKLNITDDMARMEHVSRILALDHTITSVATLTKGEASTVIEQLGKEMDL